MGRRSSVYSLDEDLRDNLLAQWRSGKALDELVVLAGGKVSRSALHRYLHTGEELYKQHKLLQDAANIWVAKLGENPQGDVGKLCEEMLRVLAHSQIKRLFTEDAGMVQVGDIALLARALRDMESALSSGAGRELKIRERITKELTAKVDKKVEEARAAGGLSADAAAAIREAIAKVAV
jgi:uncharacterized protein DUF3486